MTTSAPTIGFARLPKPVRALLTEAARAATAAATALDTLARDRTQDAALAEIVDLEDDGDRITHELQHALPSARVGSEERGDLLSAIQAIDDILDTIHDTAQELPAAGRTLPRAQLIRVTAVLKDLVHTTMTAVERIEEPPAARETLHDRVHQLDDELRVELRALHRVVADEEEDVLAALRATALLRRLRSIGQACTRARLAIEVLAAAHL